MKKTSNSKDKKNVANYFLSEFENVLTSNGPEFFRRKKLFFKDVHVQHLVSQLQQR